MVTLFDRIMGKSSVSSKKSAFSKFRSNQKKKNIYIYMFKQTDLCLCLQKICFINFILFLVLIYLEFNI